SKPSTSAPRDSRSRWLRPRACSKSRTAKRSTAPMTASSSPQAVAIWFTCETDRYLFPVMTEVLTPSFVGGLGIRLWVDGGLALGRAEIQPEYFKPGTDRVRLGVLATLVDMVAGSPAHAIINPTVDLRVTLLAPAPTDGAIELVTYPVKSGRQLFVGE